MKVGDAEWSVGERLSIRNPQLNEPCQNLVCKNHTKYIWGKFDIHEYYTG